MESYKELKILRDCYNTKRNEHNNTINNLVKIFRENNGGLNPENIPVGEKCTVRALKVRRNGVIVWLRSDDNKIYYAPPYLKKILENSMENNEFINYKDGIFGLDGLASIITITPTDKKETRLNNTYRKWTYCGFINEK